jgi:Cu/Ag efflux protein CusF
MRIRGLAVVFTVAWLLVTLAFAQPKSQKKSYTLRGKVEGVHENTKSLTVNHEKVEGWMDAMTMTYAVDDAGILKKVKAGDQIKATVYDGDYTLYKIEVVTPGGR